MIHDIDTRTINSTNRQNSYFVEKNTIVNDVDVQDSEVTKTGGISYRRNVQLKKMAVIISVVFLILSFLIVVLVMGVVVLTKVVNYPDILILGNITGTMKWYYWYAITFWPLILIKVYWIEKKNITGNVTANLGSLGHVHLTPDLQLNIKLKL